MDNTVDVTHTNRFRLYDRKPTEETRSSIRDKLEFKYSLRMPEMLSVACINIGNMKAIKQSVLIIGQSVRRSNY
jgi:hypothetical protein